MKKILVIILISLSAFLYAADHYDISFSFGADSTYGYYKGPYTIEDSLRLNLAMNVGLTPRLETSFGIRTELTPDFIDENTIFGEFTYALLADRSTASKVAGGGLNTLLSLGGFYSFTVFDDFQGAGIYLSITPLTIGNPIVGHRERLLKTNVGYDFINKKVVVSFSLVTFDYYVRGTYRDYV